LKVAVIGVGRWGRNHVRVLKKLLNKGEIDEIILVDANSATLKKVAKEYMVQKTYKDITEMKNKEKPDAAIIAVPTPLHYRVAVSLLDSIDLLIEKPIAVNIKEALDIVKLVEKEERIVAVGHIERFNPVIATLQERLNEIANPNEISFMSGERVGPGPPSSKSESYLSVAHDLMVHDIDIIVSLLHRLPRRVTATSIKNYGYPHEIEMNSIFEFSKDLHVFLRVSWRSSPTFKKRILSIHTYDKAITIDYILQSIVIERGLAEHQAALDYYGLLAAYKSKSRQEYVVLGSETNEPLLLEDLHFIKCVKRRKKPLVSAVEGYIALKNVLMALKASRTRRWVEIDWNEDFIDYSYVSQDR